MPKNFKLETRPNLEMNGYECFVKANGCEHNYKDLKKTTSIQSDDVTCNSTYYNNTTGEIVFETTFDIISKCNRKYHLYELGCEFAKSKDIPRVYVMANDRHIIDICQDKKEYLQASSGSTHTKRGIITVDKDQEIPSSIIAMGGDAVVTYVKHEIEKYFKVLEKMNFPLPTSYQIHTTNGHFQMFWVLEHEIKIKELKWSNRLFGKNERNRFYAYLDNTEMWKKYMRTTRFLNILFGGDTSFTGWQIKNMYLDDPIYNKVFRTFWNNGNGWQIEIPNEIVKCGFKKLHENVMGYVVNPNSEKFMNFCSIMSELGTNENNLKELVCEELILGNKIIEKYGVDVKKGKTCKISINSGRNEFVRKTTFAVLREYGIGITMEEAYKIVYKRYKDALKNSGGKFKGTKNNGPYSDSDFQRDFSGTFMYGVATYRYPKKFTDEQTQRSIEQRKAKKGKNLAAILVVMENNPKLVKNTTKNNMAIKDMLEKNNVKIGLRTIYNYKKELGITKDQTKLYKKNYKKADERHDQSIGRYNELYDAFGTVHKDNVPEEILKGWIKRMEDVYDMDMDEKFSSIKRKSLDKHTLKAKKETPIQIDFSSKLLEEIINGICQKKTYQEPPSHVYTNTTQLIQ